MYVSNRNIDPDQTKDPLKKIANFLNSVHCPRVTIPIEMLCRDSQIPDCSLQAEWGVLFIGNHRMTTRNEPLALRCTFRHDPSYKYAGKHDVYRGINHGNFQRGRELKRRLADELEKFTNSAIKAGFSEKIIMLFKKSYTPEYPGKNLQSSPYEHFLKMHEELFYALLQLAEKHVSTYTVNTTATVLSKKTSSSDVGKHIGFFLQGSDAANLAQVNKSAAEKARSYIDERKSTIRSDGSSHQQSYRSSKL